MDLGSERSASEEFLESIVENIPDMVFVKDAEHLRFVRFNHAGEELLGVERAALLGKSDHDLFPPEQAEHFIARDRETLARGAVLDIPEEPIDTVRGREWLHTKKIPILDAQGRPRFLLGISSVITGQKVAEAARSRAEEALREAKDELERRVVERTRELTARNDELREEIATRRRVEEALQRSEAQLRQSQKMEAIGRLAGGVAHDFNNLMTAVIGYGELLLLRCTDEGMRKDVREILKAGQRASDLTRQLLAFSRKQVLQPTVLSFNTVVGNVERMLRRLIGEDIDLVVKLEGGLWNARADASQLEQVIVNLVVNSRDAMPSGGTLTIETGNVRLDEEYVRSHPEVVAGPHVLLAVTDSGTGMTPATQARLFEPFFTTKPQGKGTGLGLSTVYGIVRQSGGSISVYSEVGRGTTFKVYFPRVADPTSPEDTQVPPDDARLRGTEAVLLVEDEDSVRGLARSVLTTYGYCVLEAANGSEALLLSERFTGPIHLLLTDVVLPKLGGREVADRLTATRPAMRVLFMSGYTENAIVHDGTLDPDTAFLQKPFIPERLARKVREVLSRLA